MDSELGVQMGHLLRSIIISLGGFSIAVMVSLVFSILKLRRAYPDEAKHQATNTSTTTFVVGYVFLMLSLITVALERYDAAATLGTYFAAIGMLIESAGVILISVSTRQRGLMYKQEGVDRETTVRATYNEGQI